jgi:hypothetical protein
VGGLQLFDWVLARELKIQSNNITYYGPMVTNTYMAYKTAPEMRTRPLIEISFRFSKFKLHVVFNIEKLNGIQHKKVGNIHVHDMM